MPRRSLLLLPFLAAALGGCAAQPFGGEGTSWAAALVDSITGVPVLTVAEDAARTAATQDEASVAELNEAWDEFLRDRYEPAAYAPDTPIVQRRR